MKYKVFIDGKEGTTGLTIYNYFKNRSDIDLLVIDENKRKNKKERSKFINSSDFVFLCLPNEAAIEAVNLCTNPKTRIIDSSSAHRTSIGWVYGFPELSENFKKKIKTAPRVAVPGCYASGFVALVYPLLKENIIPSDYPVVIQAVSGYSGGGKKAISQYEDPLREKEFNSPRLYGLVQMHKHLPEMRLIPGFDYEPIFNPYICPHFCGMTVTTGFYSRLLKKKMTLSDIQEFLSEYYKNSEFIKIVEPIKNGIEDISFIDAERLAGTNNMEIFVYGNDERIILTSRFDNLGKGAGGAAVQCMNIMMGIEENNGLK